MLLPAIIFRVLIPVLVLIPICSTEINAGSYGDSAHGSASIGVNRGVTRDSGYARGNCGHCHEQHSSIDGVEPTPGNGAVVYSLFYQNFNSAAMTSPYLETDNFCFFCHSTLTSSGQSVANFDYSDSFGCGTLGETDIRATMNQFSSHNLYDVYNFANAEFSWFSDFSNPCNACHNPHLAKDNAGNPHDPTFSAISKPSDHANLWGAGMTETMGNQFGLDYEPLFCNDSHSNREPAGSSSASQGRDNTPDYVGFCTDCHTSTANIYSTNLGRYLKKIDWGMGGDKHGETRTDSRYPRNSNGVPITGGGAVVQAPYALVSLTQDYTLSCLDCHEPHGSPNGMLLRRRVNGGGLGKIITAVDESADDGVKPNDNKDIGYLCMRCHQDDKKRGAFSETEDNVWRYIHHASAIDWDTPYCGGTPTPPDTRLTCGGDGALRCHAWSGNGMGIPHCTDCHYHGSVVTITNGKCANDPDSTRKTF